MKLMVMRFGKNKVRRRDARGINPERLLYIAFLAVFVVLLGIQAALLNPSIRSAVTLRDDMKGTPLGAEEYLYPEGEMELQLIDWDSIPELRVLVNGEERACFNGKNVTISLTDGDVVEIDGSSLQGAVEVAVSSVSSNMGREYVGRRFQIEGGIKKIAKVRVYDK